MSKAFLKFGNIEIERCKLHYSKYPIDIDKLAIKKILISNISVGENGFKYFTGYQYVDKIIQL